MPTASARSYAMVPTEASEEGEEESAAHSSGVSYKLDEELMSYALKTPSSVGAGAYVVRHELGVRFNVVAGGVISELDYALLFETFIQAFLLLNVANLMCKFIAYECLGTKSRIFKEFGEHEVSYENEYAQFAVQSIVAAHANGTIDNTKDNDAKNARRRRPPLLLRRWSSPNPPPPPPRPWCRRQVMMMMIDKNEVKMKLKKKQV